MQAIKTIVTKQCLRFCKLLFVCVSLIQTHRIFAQEYNCANEIFQSIQLKDTAFIRQLTAISNNTSNNKPTASILEIPIVVHVLHLGEPVGTGSNIADQVIYDAVKGANERWRKLNTTEGVDMEVQFCLARTDPNGNATNGIVRINASSVPLYRDKGMGYSAEILNGNFGADELQTKNLSNWRHNFVYNIWVVHKIVGDWGGYAYFPLPNGLDAIDGAVLSANSMRYNSSTLAHELGHAMGLFHTFQGSENGCPANDLCFIQGDWICDTPPHKIADCQNSVCNNSVDSLFSFKNIMSYCGGRGMFTQGQKDRVRSTIFNSNRNQLLQSTACNGFSCDTVFTEFHSESCFISGVTVIKDTFQTSLGCDSIVTTTITLKPSPNASFTYTLLGNVLTITNTTTNGGLCLWEFGDDSISTEISPTHIYQNPGTYTIKLTTANYCSADTFSTTINVLSTDLQHAKKDKQVQIYPNPTKEHFTLQIEINNAENIRIEVQNLLGQTVLSQRLTAGNTHEINLNTLITSGMYYINLIKDNNTIGIYKLLVK